MREIEGIERAIEKLAPYRKDIEAHFNTENERFKQMMGQEHDLIGRVLKCHLIIENYLETFIEAHYGIADLESAKLSYFQKAKLLPDSASPLAFIKPAVLELNSIRNKFGHNLEVELDIDNIQKINQVLEIAREGIEFENVIDRIEAFTTVACTFLIVMPKELQEAFMDAFMEIRINAL